MDHCYVSGVPVTHSTSFSVNTSFYKFIFVQRSGRHTSSNTPQMRKTHDSFGNRADKKERMRHNHFIKTAQPYKPKVMQFSC